MTRHGSEAIKPPSDVSKPGSAWRLVARDLLDPKCHDGPNVPKQFRVCIQVISAEVWQRIDGNMLDTKW